MRGPRLSLSESFRDQWDKENRDPDTKAYAPRVRRQEIVNALRDITEQAMKGEKEAVVERIEERGGERIRGVSVTTKWLDELLNRTEKCK